ncbi:terminase large subunit domain-containing protein [Methylobacterium oryzae]|uniref:terminase large subunit domain-containing protein n=1 Tax=Methylobacterium oryzae TaxID=334852 RepID=UPI002F2D0EDB
MPTLNVPQARYIKLPKKFKLFVGGYGSGKTWVVSADHCAHHWEWPKVPSGYFAPTYGHIRDIFFPTIDEVAFDWGLTTKIHETNKEVHLFSGRKSRGTIICRSMEKPQDIVGFKIGKAGIDEIDVMKMQKAELAWRKIIARMRFNIEGLPNGVGVGTTPEGFKFAYNQFVKQLQDKPQLEALYGLVRASTFDNELNLPADYIPSLMASYPPQLIAAYLNGQFVNLAAGSVYPDFDRVLNHTDAEMEDGEPLHIGMDFNVLNMTAEVNVIRKGVPYTVDELVKVRDTPTMAKLIADRYQNRAITIYPDASGGNTSTKNFAESDITILKRAGFSINVNPSNPSVKDRVNSVNAMILNAKGERRWKINTKRCPHLTEALEQQAYDVNGEPDKTTGHDHPVDAQGYFINKIWPIVRRTASAGTTKGL